MTTMFLNVGIIEGDQKRALECYVDSRYFRQRKSYAEYYVDTPTVEYDFHINDLMILAEQFHVEVETNAISISQR